MSARELRSMDSVVEKMKSNDSTTDDDATEDEEEKRPVDVASEGLENNTGIETKWYGNCTRQMYCT